MSSKLRTVLLRLVRVAVAGAAGSLVTVLPEVGDAFPANWKPFVAVGIAAILVALDKAKRWGGDPGEA